MYRTFADEAVAAGDKSAGERFEEIRKDEMKHRDAFKTALLGVEKASTGGKYGRNGVPSARLWDGLEAFYVDETSIFPHLYCLLWPFNSSGRQGRVPQLILRLKSMRGNSSIGSAIDIFAVM